MKAVNYNGENIVLDLSTQEASVITQALRKYGTDEALSMADTMLNHSTIVRREEVKRW